jgi:hypothetical protein
VNLLWDGMFPNTCLHSLTRFASDHVPLVLTASTEIPRSTCFHFETSWLKSSTF